MEKPAETQYPIHELLQRRWSPRAFSDKPVGHEHLCSLLEAARWAPSSNNEQPWHFLIATKQDQADYDRLLSCLKITNQLWARLAPVLMMSVAKLVFTDDGGSNRHAFHDVGLAVENLIVQATALGLMVHQMAGIYPDQVRELYGIPAEYEVVAAMPSDIRVILRSYLNGSDNGKRRHDRENRSQILRLRDIGAIPRPL
jgi:Nitroreductase